ncbi:hypothetical protein INT46_000719 [Mucor plumbeus]|uniref:holo-[acyl-carrier-protein] synthase n=1 Tax=Mucor plumbeus TaxID=97098 RepID=A0A8H7UU11_9FUNG|nr:hypothetical protein INT46_000719 [Mucor plumbeus]
MAKLDLLSFNIVDAFEGEKFDRALSWLPKAEHPAVMRFKFDRDKHLALANLLLRRHYFSQELQVPWFDLEFDRLPAGKPILKHFELSNYDYNTSHEGHWVIFGCTKDMKIGVDAVAIDRPKNQSIDAYLKNFQPQLTHNEMQLVMDSNDENVRLEAFYQLWGCKESYTKALGFGLSLDLLKMEFFNEKNTIKMKFDGKQLDNWAFYLGRLDSITLAVICCGFIETSTQLDSKMMEFSQLTQLLDQGSLSTSTSPANQITNQQINSNQDHTPFSRAYYNKSKPFKRTGLLWTAEMPISNVELDQKRSVFWNTAPSYGGREEIWQALHVAFSENDIIMARSILEAANIILPTGNPCEGCFDGM